MKVSELPYVGQPFLLDPKKEMRSFELHLSFEESEGEKPKILLLFSLG